MQYNDLPLSYLEKELPGGVSRMKIFFMLIAVPVLLWMLWFILPVTSIESIIEDSVQDGNVAVEMKNLRKGLFFNIDADSLTVKSSHTVLFSMTGIQGRINPLSLLVFRLKVNMHGIIGGGIIRGNINFANKRVLTTLIFEKIDISEITFLELIGIQGKGTISGSYTGENNKGHIMFDTKEASFEQGTFSGMSMPLHLFHTIRGVLDINENTVNIISVSLEGKGIHARLKGVVRDGVMDLNMEIMPEKSFLENPFFLAELEKYKVAPGLYIIPVKGNINI
jgi:type II secretion system protein N